MNNVNHFHAAIKQCNCQGNKVSGMPDLILNLPNDRMLSFNSSEYFIYPTHKNTTQAVEALFGLEILNYNTTDANGHP